MKIDPCCCGHDLDLHRAGGADSCRVCGGLSCPRFHAIGAGHPSPILILILFAALALGAATIWNSTN